MAKASSMITSFKSNVTFDYAYIRTNKAEYTKDCRVEIIDPRRVVVLIHDTTANYPDICVEFRPEVINKINVSFQYGKERIINEFLTKKSEEMLKTAGAEASTEIINAAKLEAESQANIAASEFTVRINVDMYSGIAVIIFHPSYPYHNPYSYNPEIGWNVKSTMQCFPMELIDSENFGIILESPIRMINLLYKGCAVVENLQEGFLRFRTSSFDKNGYKDRLFPEKILEITQRADSMLELLNTDSKHIEDPHSLVTSEMRSAITQECDWLGEENDYIFQYLIGTVEEPSYMEVPLTGFFYPEYC